MNLLRKPKLGFLMKTPLFSHTESVIHELVLFHFMNLELSPIKNFCNIVFFLRLINHHFLLFTCLDPAAAEAAGSRPA